MARALADTVGISRIGEITQLDVLGVPCFMAVRPRADMIDENISVYVGKGLTPLEAEVSTLMEAVERHCGERRGRPLRLSSFRDLSRVATCVHPARLPLADACGYREEQPLEWVRGRDLLSGGDRWVPAAAVFVPYRPPPGTPNFPGMSDSTGLASGNTPVEALAQALAEAIERDAQTMAEIRRLAVPIDLASLDSPKIRELLSRFERVGIHVSLKEITSEIGLPTFFAAIDDPITENPALLCIGIGAHVNAETAVLRALLEAAQSRCTAIAGSREDLAKHEVLKKWPYREALAKMSYWYENGEHPKNFRETPIRNFPLLEDEIAWMLERLSLHGIAEVVAVDLTLPELDIPVVKVLIPGLERCVDSPCRGARARAALRGG